MVKDVTEPKGTYVYDLRRLPWYVQAWNVENHIRNTLEAGGKASARFVFTVSRLAFERMVFDAGLGPVEVYVRMEGYFRRTFSGDTWELTVTVKCGAELPAKRTRGGTDAE